MKESINLPEDEFNTLLLKKMMELKTENLILKHAVELVFTKVFDANPMALSKTLAQLQDKIYPIVVKDFWASNGGFDDEINDALSDLFEGL